MIGDRRRRLAEVKHKNRLKLSAATLRRIFDPSGEQPSRFTRFSRGLPRGKRS
jgi:hypothetical protein